MYHLLSDVGLAIGTSKKGIESVHNNNITLQIHTHTTRIAAQINTSARRQTQRRAFSAMLIKLHISAYLRGRGWNSGLQPLSYARLLIKLQRVLATWRRWKRT